MATSKNTDFLHFNAYSIKELILRKLTEDSNFTDQIYPGSNLNILIDLVSYMYQCLIYNLNHSASESMFSDTLIYDNISRLVRFIGYNPKGLHPSVGQFYFDNEDGKFANRYILRYSMIDTQLTDEFGNPIRFSTVEDIHVDSTNIDKNYKFKMYNGYWKLYNLVFTASGEDFDSFELDKIGSDISAQVMDYLVADGRVDVYVEHREYDKIGKYTSTMTRYKVVNTELFTSNDYDLNVTSYARIYTGDDAVVSLRLNENKRFELKFGNNVIGKKPKAGDLIYIMYLATNGLYGLIEIDDLSQAIEMKHNPAMFGMSNQLYNLIFPNNDEAVVSYNSTNNATVLVHLFENTSKPIEEEDVNDIRANAPEWFKMGLRLVTKADYTYYVKNLRKSEVIDCYVMNNYEYAATFYKWLYDLGIEKHAENGAEYYYLNQDRVIKNNATWADPADANNVYIWVLMDDNTSVLSLKASYINDMQKLKCMTLNIVFLDAVRVNFSVSAMPIDKLTELIKDGTYDSNTDSYLEVTVDSNCTYASSVIAELINAILVNTFKSRSMKIGLVVNFNRIIDLIYSITGIQRLRTVYYSDTNFDENTVIHAIDGLSFATWSGSVVDPAEDLEVSNSARALLKFLFPVFYDTNLTSRIKVIRKTINNGVRIQY